MNHQRPNLCQAYKIATAIYARPTDATTLNRIWDYNSFLKGGLELRDANKQTSVATILGVTNFEQLT